MSEWREFLFENGTKCPFRAWEDMRNMGNSKGRGAEEITQQPWVQSQTKWYTRVILMLGRQTGGSRDLDGHLPLLNWVSRFTERLWTNRRNRRYSVLASGLCTLCTFAHKEGQGSSGLEQWSHLSHYSVTSRIRRNISKLESQPLAF